MVLTINDSKIVSVHARSVQQAKQKMDSSRKGGTDRMNYNFSDLSHFYRDFKKCP
jgi:hypothetical protein